MNRAIKTLEKAHPGNRIKNALLEQNLGDPRIENRERQAQDEHVVERVVDGIGQEGAEGAGEAEAGEVGEGGADPLGEGADVGAEEGVEGVGEGVVGSECAAGEGREGDPGAHGVHQVRTWARHLHPARNRERTKRGYRSRIHELAAFPVFEIPVGVVALS